MALTYYPHIRVHSVPRLYTKHLPPGPTMDDSARHKERIPPIQVGILPPVPLQVLPLTEIPLQVCNHTRLTDQTPLINLARWPHTPNMPLYTCLTANTVTRCSTEAQPDNHGLNQRELCGHPSFIAHLNRFSQHTQIFYHPQRRTITTRPLNVPPLLCKYVYTHHIYAYTYIDIYTHTPIYIHIQVHMHPYVTVEIYTHLNIHTSIYTCIYYPPIGAKTQEQAYTDPLLHARIRYSNSSMSICNHIHTHPCIHYTYSHIENHPYAPPHKHPHPSKQELAIHPNWRFKPGKG